MIQGDYCAAWRARGKGFEIDQKGRSAEHYDYTKQKLKQLQNE